MSKWQETIGEGFGTGKHKGEKRKVPVTDERDGGVAGFHTQHWDGRQDATVFAKAKTVNAKVRGA
jgi:hypothetical protein